MTVFVETDKFNQMLSYQPYVTTKKEKREVKYNLLDRIREALGDKWDRFKEGTRQAFDMICFLSVELGFFYSSDEYLAARHEITDRTVRNRLKELEELGQVVKVHRRTKKCNGKGKPVYLFVNHPYFQYWVELLGLNLSDFHTDFHTENAGNPCESKSESTKKIPTYSLPKKQDNYIYLSDNKIVQYVVNRLKDSIKKGNKITYLSSYVNKVFSSLEEQAYYEELKKKAIERHKEVNELVNVFNSTFGEKPAPNEVVSNPMELFKEIVESQA